VSGPTPWAPLPQPAELLEPADPDAAFQASDEWSALTNTVTQGGSPTPRPVFTLHCIRKRIGDVIRRRPSWVMWVILLSGMVVVGVAAAAAMFLLFRLHS